jgi:hypothetical protein
MRMILTESNLDLCFGWMAHPTTGALVRITEQDDFELTDYEVMSLSRLDFAFPQGYHYADNLQELIENNNLPIDGWIPGNNINIL